MPGISSSGILNPISIMRILPLYSTNIMFFPISPNPPSGVICIVSSLMWVFGCGRDVWVLAFWIFAGSCAALLGESKRSTSSRGVFFTVSAGCEIYGCLIMLLLRKLVCSWYLVELTGKLFAVLLLRRLPY